MTPRQQRFVEEYVVDLNAHQAALRAGYARHSARQTVTRLLQRPEVANAIRAATAARTERTRITADRVLLELARIAFAEIGRLADWGPEGMTLKPRQDVAEDDAAAIAEIAAGKDGGPTRLKLHDKQRALDGLARHLGLYGRTAGWLVKSPDARIEAANRAREILTERIEALAKTVQQGSSD
jgi:phage terminase small subunit